MIQNNSRVPAPTPHLKSSPLVEGERREKPTVINFFTVKHTATEGDFRRLALASKTQSLKRGLVSRKVRCSHGTFEFTGAASVATQPGL